MKNGDWFNDKRLLSKHDYENKSGTGLWSKMLDKWPHIIQLAYILYDTEKPANSKIFNKYVDIDDSVIITEETKAIHHITREKIDGLSNNKKGSIDKILNGFLEDIKEADVIVGHNVDFDRTMIVAEILRSKSNNNNYNNNNDLLLNIMFDGPRFECTQKITKPICKFLNPYKKSGKYKGPRLIEAYEHFFGYRPSPEMLHDAIIDVVVCLRVYCISLSNQSFDILNTNKKITNYIKRITPYSTNKTRRIKQTKIGKKTNKNKTRRIK
jgi:DNA polymerase III epsilon subunit-like protein